jgi:predicted transcriptional regulator
MTMDISEAKFVDVVIQMRVSMPIADTFLRDVQSKTVALQRIALHDTGILPDVTIEMVWLDRKGNTIEKATI